MITELDVLHRKMDLGMHATQRQARLTWTGQQATTQYAKRLRPSVATPPCRCARGLNDLALYNSIASWQDQLPEQSDNVLEGALGRKLEQRVIPRWCSHALLPARAPAWTNSMDKACLRTSNVLELPAKCCWMSQARAWTAAFLPAGKASSTC